MIILKVLNDNVFALNVCHAMNRSRIGVGDSMIRPGGMMVRAFDGTGTSACGKIDLKILAGPCEFEVSFLIVDISTLT